MFSLLIHTSGQLERFLTPTLHDLWWLILISLLAPRWLTAIWEVKYQMLKGHLSIKPCKVPPSLTLIKTLWLNTTWLKNCPKLYWWRKSSYLLKDLRDFDDIFRKDMVYDNIKNHKKSGLNPLSWRYSFEKTTGRLRVKATLTSLNIELYGQKWEGIIM